MHLLNILLLNGQRPSALSQVCKQKSSKFCLLTASICAHFSVMPQIGAIAVQAAVWKIFKATTAATNCIISHHAVFLEQCASLSVYF